MPKLTSLVHVPSQKYLRYNILIPVEISRQFADNECCDKNLRFCSRDFLALKGIL